MNLNYVGISTRTSKVHFVSRDTKKLIYFLPRMLSSSYDFCIEPLHQTNQHVYVPGDRKITTLITKTIKAVKTTDIHIMYTDITSGSM